MMSKLLALLLLGLSTQPLAAETYKWVDERGVTHYGDTLPPQYVNKAVTALDRQGFVKRRSEAALTPEQRQAREAELARLQDEERKALERRRKDIALLYTYTSEVEIDLARARSQQQIEARIGDAQDRLESVQARQKELAQQLEFYSGKDRAGKPRTPPAELTREIESAKAEMAKLEASQAQLRKERDDLGARFEQDKLRFRELKQLSANR